jgi:hypothetical protein
MKIWMAVAIAASVMGVAAAQADSTTGAGAPGEKDLAPAVKAFLAQHGDLCLAWYTWPRDLTAEEQQGGLNEAVQMPVLERLGLVQSADVAATSGPVKRYSLTAKGQRYYLQKKRTTLGLHGETQAHDADFCVAQLSLDKVVKWTPPEPLHGHVETLVKYTYKVKSADWMNDDQARKVFPVVDRIIHGAGVMEMTATVQQQGDKWVPVMPGQ